MSLEKQVLEDVKKYYEFFKPSREDFLKYLEEKIAMFETSGKHRIYRKLRYNEESRMLSYEGKRVKLSPTEGMIAKAVFCSDNHFASWAFMQSLIPTLESDTIRVLVSRLRQKLKSISDEYTLSTTYSFKTASGKKVSGGVTLLAKKEK